jgi:hypothetical protein
LSRSNPSVKRAAAYATPSASTNARRIVQPGRHRSSSGSVLPFVAFALLLIAAYLGFSVDVTRNIVAVRKAEFAADAAALYAYSMQTNSDGSYSDTSAWNNITAAIAEPNGLGVNAAKPWNDAPSGPDTLSGSWTSGVTFTADDVLAPVSNPADNNEKFLQLRFRRQGTDALQQLFMPAIFSSTNAGGVNAPNRSAEINRVIEVAGQPASRIGPGVPRSAGNTHPLTGFACFPLAISNLQFAAASAGTGPAQFTIDLVDSQTAAQPAQPQHIKAAFINDARENAGIGGPFYGAGQGPGGVNQLVGLLKYFSGVNDATAIPPTTVERGAFVAAFDPAAQDFQNRKQDILNALAQIAPNQFVIVPVVSQNPIFTAGAAGPFGSGANRIVGFARMRVVQLVSKQNNVANGFTVVLDIGQSVVMRNTTAAPIAVIPLVSGSQSSASPYPILPAPAAPFQSRVYDPSTNSLTKVPRGLVLAPVLSPRSI